LSGQFSWKGIAAPYGSYFLCLASSAMEKLRPTTGAVASGNGGTVGTHFIDLQHRASVLPMNSLKTDNFEQQK